MPKFIFGLFLLAWVGWISASNAHAETKVLPPAAIVVDDDSAGFVLTGTASAWHTETTTSTHYYNGRMVWTLNTTSTVENVATWQMPLTATLPMTYEIFAFVPARFADTQQAQYQIVNGTTTQTVALNQRIYFAEWVSLGKTYVAVSNTLRVRLGNKTGEPYASTRIGFDALAFVPITTPLTTTPPISLNKKIFVPAIASANVPATTTSRYVSTISPAAHEAMGCAAGTRNERGIVVLAFGQPQTVGLGYGTRIYNFQLVSTQQIAAAAQAFAQGFVRCAPANSSINLAVGTSNYKGETTFAHGRAWAQMVNSLQDSRGLTLTNRVNYLGANDMEPSWNTVSNTRAWVDGYASAAEHPYLNFGSCDGCPSASYPFWQPNNSWTVDDVWYVSFGSGAGLPLPEIYAVSGIHARQWQWISLYAAVNKNLPMNFAGVLTQYQACQDVDPVGCKDIGLDNPPQQGWAQLQAELNKDTRTAQTLPAPSDITWQSINGVFADTPDLRNGMESAFLLQEDVAAPLPALEFVSTNAFVQPKANGETQVFYAGLARNPNLGGQDLGQAAVAILVWERDGSINPKRTRVVRLAGFAGGVPIRIVQVRDDGLVLQGGAGATELFSFIAPPSNSAIKE